MCKIGNTLSPYSNNIQIEHHYHVTAKFVPWLLSPEQKQHCVEVCKDIRQQARGDPTFMSKIITGNESWVPNTKQQSSQGLQDWRHIRSRAQPKACSSFSSTFPISPRVRLSTWSSAALFWSVWGRMLSTVADGAWCAYRMELTGDVPSQLQRGWWPNFNQIWFVLVIGTVSGLFDCTM